MSTALVTDSTAYLPADLLEGLDVRVVALHVVVGGREHSEGVDVDARQVASALRSFTPVSTSRPAPAAFLEAYEAAAGAGADAVVSVHISGDMSSTIGGAELAAAESPVPVTVVDSRAMGMAMGYAVLAGARLILVANQWGFLAEISPFIKGFTLFFWAAGTWWIPLLFILGFWRHIYKRFPIRYDPQYWGMVFPLGMYTVCTFQLSRAINFEPLMIIPRYFVFIALLAWFAAFVGLLHGLLRRREVVLDA